ncbi:MAG: two-component system response regulator [Gammaproteobacteria bacterium]|nr:two-component system response regulator [Gammaproteobacteria bacterium]
MSFESSILIVDDSRINYTLLKSIFKNDYQTYIADNGETALELANKHTPDIILLDIILPDINGYEVCERLKKNPATKDIPIIFITANVDAKDEKKGFEFGAVDYIVKPFNVPVVLARVKMHLQLKIAQTQLQNQNFLLELKVTERTLELQANQDVTIMSLATLAEIRDNETGNHIRRTQNYVKLLAQTLKDRDVYPDFFDHGVIEQLYKSAPLHDIGKVGIPDAILLKPGKLDNDEFIIMKKHALLGEEALTLSEKQLGQQGNSYLSFAREIAGSHHEKWDGSGYPRNLKGEEIPLSARLMAVADVYDALISKRVYKPAYSHEKAYEIIINGSGTHFDPIIIDIFKSIHQDFNDIAQRFTEVQEIEDFENYR